MIDRWERWAAATGILYVALFLATFLVVGEGAGDSDQEILSHYAERGHRIREIVAFFLLAVAAILLIWFAGTVRAAIRRAEGEPGRLSSLAFGGAVASAALLMAGNALFASLSFTIAEVDEFTLDPNTYRLLGTAGYGLFVSSGMAVAVFVAATALASFRTGVFPQWFGWLSVLVTLAVLVSVFFFPVFLFWAWVLVLTGLLLWRPRPALPDGSQHLPY